MPDLHTINISKLLKSHNCHDNYQIIPLPVSGSGRLYFRVLFDGIEKPKSLIVSYNENISENIAQKSFTQHFRNLKFRVPEILATDPTFMYLLQTDVGDLTLFDMLSNNRKFAIELYYKVIDDLLHFQIEGIKNLDLDVAYPIKQLDERSIMWDLNYFKYYFVKPHNIDFNESSLEDDFVAFKNLLLKSNSAFFNYRDFQARNIMFHEKELWYVDFQGGRQGPLEYDLVSLLYQVKAKLDEETRSKLLQYYLKKLGDILPDEPKKFMQNYHNYIYFRLMQVMGAYGFRGLIQKKPHFLQSIGPSVSLLKELFVNKPIDENLKEINHIFKQIININTYTEISKNNGLTIVVNSFSYKKKGIPIDFTGNGGGFVFDCRSLPNPGRLPNLRDFTGNDSEIIDYLKDKKEVNYFIENTINMVSQSVQNYIDRNFHNLQINFGCTGGKHRSVYSANFVGNYLKQNYPSAKVTIVHNELQEPQIYNES